METRLSTGGPLYYVYMLAYVSAGLLVVYLNTIIFILLLRKRTIKDAKYFFLASLAVADGLIGLLTVWYGTALAIPPLPGSCSVVLSILELSMLAYVLSLIGITVDQYVKIVHPLFYVHHVALKHARYAIVLIWMLAIAYATSGLILEYDPIVPHSTLMYCSVPKQMSRWRLIIFVGVMYCVPVFLLVFLNARMVFQIRSSKRRVGVPVYTISPVAAVAACSSPIPDNALMRKAQTMFTTMIVSVAFAMLWLPANMTIMASLHSSDADIDVYDKIVVFIAGINCFVNAIIYSIRSKVFRKEFLKMVRCHPSDTDAIHPT